MDNFESRLEQSGKNFREWCEHVNGLWKEAEANALQISPGHPVVVEIKTVEPSYDSPPETPAVLHLLGFLKINDKWCIGYGLGPADLVEWWDHPWAWKPILECSLDQRLDAGKVLQKLLEKLVEAQEGLAAQAEDAAGAMAEALSKFHRT